MLLTQTLTEVLLVCLVLNARQTSRAAVTPVKSIPSLDPDWSGYPDWLGFREQAGSWCSNAVACASNLGCDGDDADDIAVGSHKFYFLYLGLDNLQTPQFIVHLPLVVSNP
jgi:hypothetical protein